MFQKPNAEKKNTLICVGTMESFGTVAASKTEGSPYYMEEVKIRPSGGSQAAKFRLMWDPAFFAPTFNVKRLTKSSEFVYKKNIASLDGPSLLEGLCGSAEAFEDLQAAFTSEDADLTPEGIDNILRDFFTQLGPVPFIYVLKQERKAVGEEDVTDKDGNTVMDEATGEPKTKKAYVRGAYYEVAEILHLTERTIKALVKRATKNAEYAAKQKSKGEEEPAKILFKFDPVDYGIDVELSKGEPAWVA